MAGRRRQAARRPIHEAMAPRASPWYKHTMQVIGHRGCAGLEPENTLQAFHRALALGVDALECDVRRTRDGRLVVIHDAAVDRTTDGHGNVADLTFAELQRLEAGGGARIPLLGEVLEAVGGTVPLLIELKEDACAEPALREVTALGLRPHVSFISFHLECLAPAATIGMQTSALFHQLPADAVERCKAAEIQELGVYFAACTPELRAQARAAGLGLWLWTPNTVVDQRRCLALRPDGIASDRPDLLLGLLGRVEPDTGGA